MLNVTLTQLRKIYIVYEGHVISVGPPSECWCVKADLPLNDAEADCEDGAADENGQRHDERDDHRCKHMTSALRPL